MHKNLDRVARLALNVIVAFVALFPASIARADEAENDAIVMLQQLQKTANVYPRAKYQIVAKVLHSIKQLDQGRELTYELLVDDQRFLFFMTDSRPNQTKMPWSRHCFSYDGNETRCIAKIQEPNDRKSFVGQQKSETGTLEEIVKQNLIYCEEMFLVNQLGFSNKRMASLGVGLSTKPIYLSVLTEMVQNRSKYRATVATQDDDIRLTIETLPDAALNPGQGAVRHELVIDEITHRPSQINTWLAPTLGELGGKEATQKTTTIKWESLKNGDKWFPASIRYSEKSGTTLTYEELAEVKILRDFGDGPPAGSDFDWSQFDLEVGDAIGASDADDIQTGRAFWVVLLSW